MMSYLYESFLFISSPLLKNPNPKVNGPIEIDKVERSSYPILKVKNGNHIGDTLNRHYFLIEALG